LAIPHLSSSGNRRLSRMGQFCEDSLPSGRVPKWPGGRAVTLDHWAGSSIDHSFLARSWRLESEVGLRKRRALGVSNSPALSIPLYQSVRFPRECSFTAEFADALRAGMIQTNRDKTGGSGHNGDFRFLLVSLAVQFGVPYVRMCLQPLLFLLIFHLRVADLTA